jgi:PII-like signaling protein
MKLTTYFGERERSGGRFLSEALLDLYGRHGVTASVLLRGTAGFGARHRLRSADLLTPSEDLPLVSVAIDEPERIDELVPGVRALQQSGLITLERAQARPRQPTKLTVYLGRGEGYRELCVRLRDCGLDGATVLLGVDGTVHGERRRAGFFGPNGGVPVMVIAVGEGAAVERALETLPEVPVTLERIRLCRRDGVALAEPEPRAGEWHKLMLHSSDHAAHDELVRRLRGAGTAGATTLRGAFGFHGDHEPHGDRILQLRRGVPAVTVIVDTPEHVDRSFAIVSELTPRRGLVTSETVPVILN